MLEAKSSSNVKKAMVIVEPRRHPDLERVVTQFDRQMPIDWDLYVFHGKSTKDYSKNATRNCSSGRNIFLKALDVDNLTDKEYNKLFKETSFWNQIDAEDILVFQTDTAICGGSKFSIDHFRQYGYIGCSFKKDSIGFNNQLWDKKFSFYGIGGLSFRKKSFTLQCIHNKPNVDPYFAEDVFYSECVHKETGSLKPESADVLSNFCSQYNFNSRSFGAHKTKFMAKEDKDEFYGYCPEARFLDTQH